MKDQIHTFRIAGSSYAVLSTGGPHALTGTHSILMVDGETAEQALHRASQEYRDKAARLLKWAERCEKALEK